MTIFYLGLGLLVVVVGFIWYKTFTIKKRKHEESCTPVHELRVETLPVPEGFAKVKLETPNENAPLAMNVETLVEEPKQETKEPEIIKQEPELSEEEKSFINEYNNEMSKNNY